MRLILAMASLCLIAAALSGCASDKTVNPGNEPASAAFHAPLFQGEADQGSPAGSAKAHGEPHREDGPVTTGMNSLQFPGMFWARRTVNITNDFGGASLGTVMAGLGSGSIKVQPGNGDGYAIEAVLEADGMTEQAARDSLDRIEVKHTDSLESDGLHLTTVVDQKPAAPLIPLVQVSDGTWMYADVTITLPASPAYDLTAETSSGDVTVGDLRGPSFQLSASSGDVMVGSVNAGDLTLGTSSGDIGLDTVQANHLAASASSGSVTGKDLRIGVVKADTSSGDISLQGLIDTLEADASSGSLDIDAHGQQSGAYKLSASSGDITLKVLSGNGHAYRITADASSGSVEVKLDDTESTDSQDHHASAVSRGFDSAPIQTVVEAETSSGDITIQG
jgi:hypothetical protein